MAAWAVFRFYCMAFSEETKKHSPLDREVSRQKKRLECGLANQCANWGYFRNTGTWRRQLPYMDSDPLYNQDGTGANPFGEFHSTASAHVP